MAKKKPLPRFEMRAEFEAWFPHPRGIDRDHVTLRFIVTAEGEHMDELREHSRYLAKLKMELLGLEPLGIERDGFDLVALQVGTDKGFWPVVDRVPAEYEIDRDSEAGRKALKARLVVPEDRIEALELYDDATKYPTLIRSARSVIRKPDEPKAWIMVETMAGARFKFDTTRSGLRPKSGKEVGPWLPMLEPLNDQAVALKAADNSGASGNAAP